MNIFKKIISMFKKEKSDEETPILNITHLLDDESIIEDEIQEDEFPCTCNSCKK